jgi:hypothetical protein
MRHEDLSLLAMKIAVFWHAVPYVSTKLHGLTPRKTVTCDAYGSFSEAVTSTAYVVSVGSLVSD